MLFSKNTDSEESGTDQSNEYLDLETRLTITAKEMLGADPTTDLERESS